ncbi:M13 family metallopeptidase [Phenylobacterium soli]|uniref:M13 family peptidase n=1 Tax=Phenylobacterium soli TaxID=2170551 RepID=A0A328AKG8_9CAUL|nr:M13 family metallopeptidase [Phenylobacterium soli]RAK55017.1 M13 family peptidase [Phenylobacterium soli]
MTLRNAWLAAAAAAVLTSACAGHAAPPSAAAAPPPPAPIPAAAPAPKPELGAFGVDLTNLDPSVAPGDDFFRYANGSWLKRTEIPADRSVYTSFAKLRQVASERTRTLIQAQAEARAPEGSEARKIGDFYASFMDEAAIEALGATPLKPELATIAGIHDRKGLARYLGSTLRADVDVLNATSTYTPRLFGLWVVEDLNDTSRYEPYMLQGGLGMPDREYYLSNSPKFVEIRGKYEAHVARMLTLAGEPDAAAKAKRIVALETAMARVHWTPTETSDVTRTNTRWKLADFPKKAPGLDWPAFFEAAGLSGQPEIGAWQASAISGLSKLTATTSLATWKDYLTYHAAERAAPFLSKAFVDENFDFQGKTLSGTPEQEARWKRGVAYTSAALGEAIGKLYADKYFPPEDKAQVQGMVKNILAAFDKRIDRLDWMSPATKAKAHAKLATFQVGVGYPDKWRDYSGLTVTPGDAYGNQQRAELFEYRRNLAKLGHPVDRGEWYMTPQTVNALNAPLQNSIIFPAAILQPPFFDPHADPAVNYGAIGGVIGHEISHSFDDNGALFDAHGNLRNWWTPEDMAHFKAAGQALARQYDAYQPLPDLHVNGQQTLSENIADLAGLATAYDAYRLSLNGAPAPVIDGYTADQRFFLGWAQDYATKYREAALRRALITDGHSPGEYRADIVRNLDPWYGAFDVKPDQKLALPPEKRVRIW